MRGRSGVMIDVGEPVRARSTLTSLVVIAGLLPLLAGCTPSEPSPSPSPSASVSVSPEPSNSSSPEPSADPSASPSAEARPAVPVTAGCLDLVPLQTMYDFDPNFGIDEGFTPPGGSFAATAVAESGVGCRWVQQTNGADIVIAASKPSSSAYEAARAAAGVGAGSEAFAVDQGVGTIQVFDGTSWIVASSSYFGTAEDARPLIDSVANALR